MKNFKLILLTCFCLFLFTVSCDKEPVLSQNQATPNVIQARANAAAKLRTDIDKAFLNYDFSKYKIAPLWDLAIVHKNKKSVEVPYTVNNKLLIPGESKTLKGRQRLLLTLEKSKVSVMIVQYLPNNEFIGNIKEINAENFKQKKFNGRVVFQSLGVEKQYIWILNNGKVDKKKTGRVLSKRSYRPNGWVEQCETVTVRVTITHYENGEWVEDGSYEEEREECETVWVEDNNDDDGNDDDDNPTDCNMHPELPWCDNGNGGGGDDDSECTNKLSQLIGEANVSNTMISTEIIDETPDQIQRVYRWKALQGGSYHIESTEKATIDKTVSPKKLISFTHETLQRVGSSFFGEVEVQSPTAFIDGSEYSKYVELNYYIKYTIICLGSHVTSDIRPYTSSQFFSANPPQ